MDSKTTKLQARTSEAGQTDLEQIDRFCDRHSPLSQTRLSIRSLSSALLRVTVDSQLVAVVGLDFTRKSIAGPWFRNRAIQKQLFRQVITKAERLAACYGMDQIKAYPTDRSGSLFEKLGYAPATRGQALVRSISRRTTRYGRRIRSIAADLGIPDDYGVRHKLKLQPEAKKLHSIGKDIYDRPQKMAPPAAVAWKKMARQAKKEGILIQPVSAFRSVEYQAGLVTRKLERGQVMSEILAVSAAPGYSEHHTGCAIDITTPDYEVLEEEFENSPAFAWLGANASQFGFGLSFPKDNRHKIAYEPWHWCWRGPSKTG